MKIILLFLCFGVQSLLFSQLTTLVHFNGAAGNGGRPFSPAILLNDYLYGTTLDGGQFNYGTIFRVKTDGTNFLTLFEFDSINGKWAMNELLTDGTDIYGMTNIGGSSNKGIIYKINPTGTPFTKLHDFTSAIGSTPRDNGLFLHDGYLYGLAKDGGAANKGVVFKISTTGTYYAVLHSFNTTDGALPRGALVSVGNSLYGMTLSGGTQNPTFANNRDGVIFKINYDGSGFAVVHDFNYPDGSAPIGALQYDGTYLYGVTYEGEANFSGDLFRILPSGLSYTRLLDFNVSNGFAPHGEPVLLDGVLYGFTKVTGNSTSGNIYKKMPDGTGYLNLHNFNVTDGHVVLCSPETDGTYLYGTTVLGGNGTQGTVFKYGLAGNVGIDENESNLQTSIFPNPFSEETILRFNTSLSNALILLYSSAGKKVLEVTGFSGDTYKLTRNNLESGLYFLQIVAENQVIGDEKLMLSE